MLNEECFWTKKFYSSYSKRSGKTEEREGGRQKEVDEQEGQE